MQKKFEENGYLLIKNFCDVKSFFTEQNIENHKKQKKGIHHFRRIGDELILIKVKNEENVGGCSSRYKYPDYEKLHFLIKDELEKILGKKLHPSFFYDRMYFAGSELKYHIDRPSCEVSVTLHINSNLNKPWYIFLKSHKNNTVNFDLNAGDAVVYNGTEVPHWRLPLPSKYNKFQKNIRKIFRIKDDTYYYQIFFHYVYSDGKYAHHAWDYPNQNNYVNQYN